jgi:hypothetical protein
MPRKKRPLDRDGGALRDARLVVIASEDTLAVRDNFRGFDCDACNSGSCRQRGGALRRSM